MATQYPSVNDTVYDLIKKIVNNSAIAADAELGDVASITGTANQITASASTGAITLSIPSAFVGPGSIAATTTVKAGTSFLGLNGQTIIGDANGAWAVTANGTAQNITLTPSTTGKVVLAHTGGILQFTGGTAASLVDNGGVTRFQWTSASTLINSEAGAANAKFISTHLLLGGQATDGALGAALQIPSTSTAGMAIYNTSDVTTNYEALQMYWSGNVAKLRALQAGSGTARQLQLLATGTAGGVHYLQISPPGTNSEAFRFTNGNSIGDSGFNYFIVANTQFTGTTGQVNVVNIAPTYNQASGNAANTDLLINRNQAAVGSGAQLLIDAQVGGVSQFNVSNGGVLTMLGNIQTGSTAVIGFTNSGGLRRVADGAFSFGNSANSGLTSVLFTGTGVAKFGATAAATIGVTSDTTSSDLTITQTATGLVNIASASSQNAGLKLTATGNTTLATFFVGGADAGIDVTNSKGLNIRMGSAGTTSILNIQPTTLTVGSTSTLRFGATALATIGVSADTTAGVLTFTAPSAGSFSLTGGAVAVAKQLITTPTALTYASPTSVDVTLASCFTVTTVNATGSVTFNATAGGTAGQEMTILITNDATSAKTITFGTNFKSTGTLTAGAASRQTTITFKSDGTNFLETGRAVLTT